MNKIISHILIPGRHHLLTQFQYDYFKDIIDRPGEAKDVDGQAVSWAPSIDLVWAVTSANHSNTRRNPLPGYRREAAIEQFGLPVPNYVFPIDNIDATPRFADHTIKSIEVVSRGQFRLTPANTAVAVSTPAVIAMYERLGFTILPLELSGREPVQFQTLTAWEVTLAVAAAGANWRQDATYQSYTHPASKQLLEKYLLGDLIVEVHNDPLLGDEGDITETRDYQVYRQAFDDGAERKYGPVRPYLKSGRIVDVGCATGSIIKLMSEDSLLAEADLYGIEVARPLYEYCQQRLANGDFSNDNTFFYQRNIMTGKLFPDNSVDTTTTFSLTHEIESYIGRDGLLKFIRQVYDQTAPGGVFINSDVVGPEHGDQLVLLELSDRDGDNETEAQRAQHQPASPEYLSGLSTTARFVRFAADFRHVEGDGFKFTVREIDGKKLVELRLADAADFLSKKDYTDSWYSEMHERFCYWAFSDWKAALETVGFTVHPESHAFRNEWLVENRYKTAAMLWRETDGKIEGVDYPVTNLLLIAQKG